MTRLEALRASVEKWRANAQVRHPSDTSISSRSCPLCTLYLDDNCRSCPVFEVAEPLCQNTPYVNAAGAHLYWARAPHEVSRGDNFRAAAQAEAEFLEELLEAEEEGRLTSSLQPPKES